MPLLFSYGTLQQPDVQRATFGRLLDGTTDALVGFEETLVRIEDQAVLATSGRTHHPIIRPCGDDTRRVPGMVFEITEEELGRADRYEVAAYRRIAVTLASGRHAWVYVDARATGGA
jgi:Gamma-glutamyl cyclotransferase, AIG2-like